MSDPTTEVARPRVELNGPAPDFKANSTQGEIQLSTFAPGKWILLFSHPADFTPVCTTEFVEFAKRFDDFEKRNVQLIGNSVDSIYSHIAWIRNIEEKHNIQIKFPVIADLDQKVAITYGMIHTPASATATVRCVYFIDPKRIVRAMIYYPLNVGRNFDEITRVVDALQAADRLGLACPANWKPGEDHIVPAPVTQKAAAERVADKTVKVTDWYLSRKSGG
jgi:peroxiredoxin (alkyl hydroperoxide reductase subunit C)